MVRFVVYVGIDIRKANDLSNGIVNLRLWKMTKGKLLSIGKERLADWLDDCLRIRSVDS